MEEGAFGVSSGLDYPPGAYATTDELAELANEAAKLGGIYHTHVRYSLGDRFLDPFREAIEIGRRGEAPAHITHFYHRLTFPGTPDQMLELVDDGDRRRPGRQLRSLPVRVGQHPAPDPASRSGSSTAARRGPRSASPTAASATGSASDLAERGQLFAGAGGIRDIRIGYLRRPENLPLGGPDARRADRRRAARTPSTRCATSSSPRTSGRTRSRPARTSTGTRRFLRHPGAMIGTDSVFVGAKPSPRTYGSYPRILGQFVRDEALLGLEDAVRRMTCVPAARLGLRDRGTIRDGAAADLVIFDPATIRSDATIDDPRRDPVGIETVIVAGARRRRRPHTGDARARAPPRPRLGTVRRPARPSRRSASPGRAPPTA